MLTGFVDGILCCLSGKSANIVVPIKTSEPADHCKFVEVKPGRVMRICHIVPQRAVIEEPDTGETGTVSCKRKITVYHSGQLFIENVSEAIQQELVHCQNGESAVEVDALDNHKTASREAVESSTAVAHEQPQHTWCKPKRTVMIDYECKITQCKETNPDVALFFIHGVGGSMGIWKSQLDYFSQLGYEVIAPDLVGHGGSSAPQITAAYTFYALADDIRIIFMTYAKRRNILIGHSYG